MDRTTDDMEDKQVLLLVIVICISIYFLLPKGSDEEFDDTEGKPAGSPVGVGPAKAHEPTAA